jgi:hypothetical protein
VTRSALYGAPASVANGVQAPAGSVRRWNSTLDVSADALAVTVAVPDAIGGALTEIVGGSLSTTTVIAADVVVLPARSVAMT